MQLVNPHAVEPPATLHAARVTPSHIATPHVGGLTPQDIFDYMAAWFGHSPGADFNHSGTVTVQDMFDFLAAWFTGCS